MAEHHEVNEIVKRINKELLEEFFNKLGVTELDEEWKKSTSRNIKPLCEALAKLPDSVQEEVGMALEEISPVGRESKNIPVIISALSDMKCEIPQGFEEWNAPCMAAWCWINLSELLWARLKGRAIINNYSPGEWKSFDLAFEEDPERGQIEKKKDELMSALTKAISSREYRGHHCRCECYVIGDKENVVFKLTDHKSADEVWAVRHEFHDYLPSYSFKRH